MGKIKTAKYFPVIPVEPTVLQTLWLKLAGNRGVSTTRVANRLPTPDQISRLPELWKRRFAPGIPLQRRQESYGSWLCRKKLLALTEVGALISISHADRCVVGIGLSYLAANQRGIAGVGVDIERSDRVVSAAFRQRIMSKKELARDFLHGLNGVEIWTVKEACFKADPGSSGSVVSQYQIVQFSEGSRRGVVKKKALQFAFFCVQDSSWTLAIAICTR